MIAEALSQDEYFLRIGEFTMATEALKVYLDHLIKRENLRYQRSSEKMSTTPPSLLRMSDLFGDHRSARAASLRKPDFQRTTWSWTAEDCVSLLESIVNEQVIPSIIMWASPENAQDYVLDGGHRISVVMAWLNDDWGDNLRSDVYRDEEEERIIKQAAKEVRDLVKARIGSISDFQQAEEEFTRAVMDEKAPKSVLDPKTFKRGYFYQRLRKGDIGFHILWVIGDYEKAEQSFLKINKSGRPLSEWETTIVENRYSSFIRNIMAISSVSSAKHYWHTKDLDEGMQEENQKKIDEIIAGVNKLHEILFKPTYETPIRRLQQPLLVPPDIQTKPLWLSQLLTIVQGGKGQNAETRKLIERDKNASPDEIISHGRELVHDTLDVLSHLVGPSPKSLAVVPVLYFYTNAGRYVRSLLYGLVYWLHSGSEEDILNRKRIFSIHRSAFEQMLLGNKADVVTGITRKTGSGQEVTNQTAQYYQGLLELLIQHKDDIESKAFSEGYSGLTKKLTHIEFSSVRNSSGKSRQFTPNQKSALVLDNFFRNPNRCDICGGVLDPAADLQHDHIFEHARGGKTLPSNQRLVHPFCNNPTNREVIEAGRNGKETIRLPRFIDPDLTTEPLQLELFDDSSFI
jgi:hypothetical protein